MEKEELKQLFQEELNQFKSSLSKFIDKDGLEKSFSDFKSEIEKKYEDFATKEILEGLKKSVEEQGRLLTKLEKQGKSEEKSDFREKLESAIKAFNPDNHNEKQFFATTQKAIYSNSFTNDTNAMRIQGVGEIKRGVPYIRNLFSIH